MSASENPHVARKETALLAALSVIENSLALLDNPRPIYSPHASSKIELARYRRWYKILEFRIRRQILMAGVGPHVVIASAIGDRSRQGTLRRGVGVKKPWGGYDADQLGRWIVEVEDVCSKMRDEFDELTAGGKDG